VVFMVFPAICWAMSPEKRQQSRDLLRQIQGASSRDRVLGLIKKNRPLVTAQVVSVAMTKLRRGGDAPAALRVFEDSRASTKMNRKAVNAAIGSCGRNWRRAFRFFDELRRKEPPDLATYRALLTACEKGGQWERAVALFADMVVEERGLRPDAECYAALISACGRGGQWQRASLFFEDMQRRGIRPTLATYNALISAFGRSGEWRRAMDIFHRLKRIETTAMTTTKKTTPLLKPDMSTYDAAIAACARGEQWEEAEALVREAAASLKVGPTVATYAAVLSAVELDQVDRALELVTPGDARTYHTLLIRCDDWRKGLKLFDHLLRRLIEKKPEEDPALVVSAYDALISACGKAGEWETALRLFGELQSERGLEPTAATFRASIRACEKAGRREEASELFADLRRRGLTPDVVTYSAVIAATEKSGLSERALELFAQARSTGHFSRLHSVPGAVDLHRLSVPVARTAVRASLDGLRRGDFAGAPPPLSPDGDFLMITGGGTGTGRRQGLEESKTALTSDPAVLQPAILALIEDEYADLDCAHHPQNPGILVVQAASLRRWIDSIRSDGRPLLLPSHHS